MLKPKITTKHFWNLCHLVLSTCVGHLSTLMISFCPQNPSKTWMKTSCDAHPTLDFPTKKQQTQSQMIEVDYWTNGLQIITPPFSNWRKFRYLKYMWLYRNKQIPVSQINHAPFPTPTTTQSKHVAPPTLSSLCRNSAMIVTRFHQQKSCNSLGQYAWWKKSGTTRDV